MEDIDNIKILDILLRFIAVHAHDYLHIKKIWDKLLNENPGYYLKGTPSFKDQMFNKLLQDGYVEQNLHKKDKFRISYKGLEFVKAGGYESESKNKKRRKQLKNLQAWLLVASSIGLVIIELCKAKVNPGNVPHILPSFPIHLQLFYNLHYVKYIYTKNGDCFVIYVFIRKDIESQNSLMPPYLQMAA